MEEATASDNSSNLGTVFIQLVNFLKIYTIYCNGYNKSLEVLTRCEKDNPVFAVFLKTTEQKTECNGLRLRDFLIKPIQRLCKYPLLFKELLSVTPQSSADYPLVLQTCEKLNSITRSVNENAAEILNFQKLLLFNKSVSGFEVDIGSFWYIRDEILIDTPTGRTRHVYLMTQAVIITKIPNSKIIKGKKEKFLVALDIESIECVLPLQNENEFMFVVSTAEGKQSYRWTTLSAASRSSWLTDLTETIEQANQGHKVPKNVFHVVDTSSKGTVRKQTRKKDSSNKKKLSKIFSKYEENEHAAMPPRAASESCLPDASDNENEKSPPPKPLPNPKKLERSDSNLSTRSVPAIPSYNPTPPAPEPSKPIPTIEKLQVEIERLQEQVNQHEKEKKEWIQKEKLLLTQIQTLARYISDKENVKPRNAEENHQPTMKDRSSTNQKNKN